MTNIDNIDTEQWRLSEANFAAQQRYQAKIDAMPLMRPLTPQGSIIIDEKGLKNIITADREKLIKHLAFYYGLPEAEMRKVSEGVK